MLLRCSGLSAEGMNEGSWCGELGLAEMLMPYDGSSCGGGGVERPSDDPGGSSALIMSRLCPMIVVTSEDSCDSGKSDESMDDEAIDTPCWLEYCSNCTVPKGLAEWAERW